MRTELKTKLGVRKLYTGTFEKYGSYQTKDGGFKASVLLLNIKAKGQLMADHMWVELTPEFDEVNVMEKGDTIMFYARAAKYRKNNGTQSDIGLRMLTRIRRCAG